MESIKKRFKKLMNSLCLEYIANEADNMCLNEMIDECKYWLFCYTESGNSLYDMKYDEDPNVRKKWINDTNRLKRFLNTYDK